MIELLSSPPAAPPRDPVSHLEALLRATQDDAQRLVEHQLVLDDTQTRRLSELRRGIVALSDRLRFAEEAARVLADRLADLSAVVERQGRELCALRAQLGAREDC